MKNPLHFLNIRYHYSYYDKLCKFLKYYICCVYNVLTLIFGVQFEQLYDMDEKHDKLLVFGVFDIFFIERILNVTKEWFEMDKWRCVHCSPQ
jgi:hypothetical protein